MVDHLSLFASYQSLPTTRERSEYALANPRLLWVRTIRDLSEHLERQSPAAGVLSRLFRKTPQASGQSSLLRRDRLEELERFRLSFRSVEDYPIGMGPLETLARSGEGLAKKLAASVALETLDIVAPPYLQIVAYHGEDLLRKGIEWGGLVIARCAADAALALADRGEVDKETFHAVASYVQTAVYYLCGELDPSVRYHALQAALRAIDHAKRVGDNEALGRLHQVVGSLHSDIWTMPGGLSGAQTVDLDEAVARAPVSTFKFDPPPSIEAWPSALESLCMAVDWYRSAIPYREGLARGLSYKAIVQTEYFITEAFGIQLKEDQLLEQARLATDLLAKHPHGGYHMASLLTIAQRQGWALEAPLVDLPQKEAQLIKVIEGAFEPGLNGEAATERRRTSHAAALQDLRRVLRHKLPWALYLRNFDFANEIRLIGDPVIEREEGNVRVVVPEVSYSIIDHKVLELFGEGVVTICDPNLSNAHLLSTIPMLSLRNDTWLPAVRELANASSRIVMLLDAVTPGVGEELKMLEQTGSTERTLIVLGQSFRDGAGLPAGITERFTFLVDWLDFSHDERHFNMRYKAHGIVQKELSHFVRSDTRQVVAAWLEGVPR